MKRLVAVVVGINVHKDVQNSMTIKHCLYQTAVAVLVLNGCSHTSVHRHESGATSTVTRIHSIHRVERCASMPRSSGRAAYMVREAIVADPDAINHLLPCLKDSGEWLSAAWIGYLGHLVCLDKNRLPIAHIDVALHNSRITIVKSLFENTSQPLKTGDSYVLSAPSKRDDLGFDLIVPALVRLFYEHLRVNDPDRIKELENHIRTVGDITIKDAISGVEFRGAEGQPESAD